MEISSDQFTILLVEDSSVDERVIRHILEKENYRVFSAMNQHDGLEMIKRNKPDLVILDYVLPDGNGLEICRAIKETAFQNNHMLPVIMLTIKKETKDIVEGFRSGADDYVIKPPIREDLLARVRRLLRTRQLHVELQDTYQQLSNTVNQLQRELDIIANLQQSFLPTNLPHHPKLNIAARYEPSMIAGGDYYDIIKLDDTHWGIVMADIAGHGASAAVVMALTQMTVKEFAPGCFNPKDALLKFHSILSNHVQSEHFVTLFYGIFNLDSFTLQYSSAGHPPPLLYDTQTDSIQELLNQEGYPLLTFENDEIDVKEITLKPHQQIILYTDGLLDVKNEKNIFFGIDNFKMIVQQQKGAEVDSVVDSIFSVLESYRYGESYNDDVSLMILEHKTNHHT